MSMPQAMGVIFTSVPHLRAVILTNMPHPPQTAITGHHRWHRP